MHTVGETVVSFDPAATDVVDEAANTIDLGADTRGLRTGDSVVYRDGDGSNAAIGGLQDGKAYFVIAEADGKVKLANTREEALAGTAIDLTSKGSGSGHRLVFDRTHSFGASAISGASGGDTGVAGSLALNVGLSDAYAAYDAERKFTVQPAKIADPKACQCGEVLKGAIRPWECKVFGTDCTPQAPLGALMVSSEGACAAYYRFADVSSLRRRSAQAREEPLPQ